ncbi:MULTISPECIES: hypothetical protein [Cupriavidus]|uniref:hypothetical protein n=1 Tax=Cupriavidus TaxID=106589 RepID=UPI0011285CFF|nr:MULTISPECIES: hypothetical protein [Cupriavidus]QYY29266.1 hypothetical protein K2O51_03390 [Cupriavidus pinatubonensis]
MATLSCRYPGKPEILLYFPRLGNHWTSPPVLPEARRYKKIARSVAPCPTGLARMQKEARSVRAMPRKIEIVRKRQRP